MKNRVDERKLTDYVLGELSPEETVEIERLLEESAELRAEVDEIRTVTSLLAEELGNEPQEVLDATQRDMIRRQPAKRALSRGFFYKVGGGLVAASLVAVVLLNFPALLDKVTFMHKLTATVGIEDSSSSRSLPNTSTETDRVYSAPQPVPPVSESLKDSEGDQRGAEKAPEAEPSGEAVLADRNEPVVPGSRDQEPRPGAVQGKVADQSGGIIPGANVVLRRDGEEVLQTVTDEAGRFLLAEVKPGEYEVGASMPGFKEFRGKVEVLEEESVGLEATLEIGNLTSTVMISSPSRTSIAAETAPSSQKQSQVVRVGGVAGAVATAYLDPPQVPEADFNTEAYDRITENEFTRVTEKPLSTFSVDVDTASYSNVRRFLTQRELPPKDAVRIEELINYFDYDYEPPSGEHPFAAHIETATSPWNEEHLLVRLGLKGEEIAREERRPGNFVFLLDVSGSMRPANKLPLLKRALKLMVDNLNEKDRVAMVVYAGASGLVLPSTPCSEKETILQAMERLEAGGSTNGGSGIQLAYQVAANNLIEEGINRVILATDGDFNVGVTNQGDLTRLIEEKAESGVFLTVLGFGMGNYKDSNLEKLADRGNGNYAYIDTLQEARKVLVEEMGSTLVTIAKDVKIQVEFNPSQVQAYRLIGYENRKLRDQDFNDDTKDAGEIGAGHTVTAFYEIVPHGVEIDLPPAVDPLKYQQPVSGDRSSGSSELLTLKLRYKEPKEDRSKLIQVPVEATWRTFEKASEDLRFAASVAGFGMLLRESEYKGSLTWDQLRDIAENSTGTDPHSYRKEFINLVRMARAIADLEGLQR